MKLVQLVQEHVALTFVVKHDIGFFHVPVAHFRLECGPKQFCFMVTNEDVGKSWAKGGSHDDSVDLAMHNIIEAELDGRSGHLQ